MATNSQAAAAPAPTPAPTLEEAVRAPLDAAIAQLAIGERTWGAFTVGQRARLLDRVTETVGAHAAEWADVAATAKSLPQGDPLRGEEWLSGPYGTLTALASYANSLRALEAGKSPAGELRIDRAPGGRFRAHHAQALPAGHTHGLAAGVYLFLEQLHVFPGIVRRAHHHAAHRHIQFHLLCLGGLGCFGRAPGSRQGPFRHGQRRAAEMRGKQKRFTAFARQG